MSFALPSHMPYSSPPSCPLRPTLPCPVLAPALCSIITCPCDSSALSYPLCLSCLSCLSAMSVLSCLSPFLTLAQPFAQPSGNPFIQAKITKGSPSGKSGRDPLSIVAREKNELVKKKLVNVNALLFRATAPDDSVTVAGRWGANQAMCTGGSLWLE